MIKLDKQHEVFFYELNGRGYEFENKTWIHGLGDVGGLFDDDQLNMVWEMYLAGQESKQAEIDSLKAQLTEYTKAALDVIGERNRQIEQEYYSIEHDDSYQMNELTRAAASYVINVVSRGWVFNSAYGPEAYQSEEVPDLWPWLDEYWKPKNPRRDLVKAAALIIAEIDRMDRCSAGEQS
ncbi:hypothetical protein [Acinetobacter soli]|uniref:hypothetical protein n=1 Tax=Acinetobacter soli TaxID=487316 RepID=UPI001D18D7FC|nr:hypothetical protein [Acinetobacter soli]